MHKSHGLNIKDFAHLNDILGPDPSPAQDRYNPAAQQPNQASQLSHQLAILTKELATFNTDLEELYINARVQREIIRQSIGMDEDAYLKLEKATHIRLFPPKVDETTLSRELSDFATQVENRFHQLESSLPHIIAAAIKEGQRNAFEPDTQDTPQPAPAKRATRKARYKPADQVREDQPAPEADPTHIDDSTLGTPEGQE